MQALNCSLFIHVWCRLLGWWSIDEGSKEEQARLFYAESTGYLTGHLCSVNLLTLLLFLFFMQYMLIIRSFVWRYNTFCGYPPEVVRKMPKKDLAEEVAWYNHFFCSMIFFYVNTYLALLHDKISRYWLPSCPLSGLEATGSVGRAIWNYKVYQTGIWKASKCMTPSCVCIVFSFEVCCVCILIFFPFEVHWHHMPSHKWIIWV